MSNSVRNILGMIDYPNNSNIRITNQGHNIPAICEKRLNYNVYIAKVYLVIGRTINHDTIPRTHLSLLEEHLKLAEYHDDPKKLPAIRWTFGITKEINLVPIHLHYRLVISKVPLS